MPLDPTFADYYYLIGRLAALVWPNQDDRDINWERMIEHNPAAALGGKFGLLVVGFKQEADTRDAIMEMIDVNAISPTSGFDKYLLGYHHQRAAMLSPASLTPEELARIGQALYGERWQTDMATALCVDSRRVREWVSGERSIPKGKRCDILALAAIKGHALTKMAGEG